ncbi:MFS transporter [Kitasatospora sp. NPDC052896]|uniref:MFS transporter n=1 Tax=Kitasatospora sp. NPDC052896 TaxID=3364061 RepID=UPI0037CC1F12
MRNSAFRRYLTGQLVSNVGTWMQRTAQGWLVLRLTHNNGVALGIVTALQFLPQTLLGLYGGILADRYPKHRLLLITQSLLGLQALLLGILTATGSIHLWHVYALAFALGTVTALDSPARHALIGLLVGRDRILPAVSLNSAQFNTARILGPALAGVAIVAIDTGPVFLINAATYLVVVAGLAALRRHETRPQPETTPLRAALHHIRINPSLLLPVIIAGVVGTIGLNFQVTIPLMAEKVFRADAATFGALVSAFGFGGLLGALQKARGRTVPTTQDLLRCTIVFGLLETAVGLMPTIGAFAVVLVLVGFSAAIMTTTANVLIQYHASPTMRGRVLSLYLLALLGGTPLGSLTAGWTAQTLGARSSLVLGGLIITLFAVALAVFTTTRIRAKARTD